MRPATHPVKRALTNAQTYIGESPGANDRIPEGISSNIYNRHLKHSGRKAAVNKQISIEKDSRPSEFSRPLTSFTLLIEWRFECDRFLSAAASVCLRSLIADEPDSHKM